jgi:large subunit ribosomal protein L4
MAVIDVMNQQGEKVSEIELSDDIFDVPVKASILHDVVRMQLAGRRSGTAAVKHRGDVRGSTKKLFRQKGTGRARRGDIKSPLLRGGGSVFGPDPRSYAHKMPKKVRKLALKMALTSKLKENKLVVLNEMEFDEIKTRKFVEVMQTLGVRKALIVTDKENERLEKSSRNVPHVKVLKNEGINVYDLLAHDNLILLESSVAAIQGRLA